MNYALLWSKQANGLHIEPLDRTIEAGRRFLKANQSNDYLLIGVGTSEEMDSLAEKVRPLLIEREAVKRLYGSDPD